MLTSECAVPTGARTPSYFPSGKRRGRPPGSKNSHPPRRGRGRGRGGRGVCGGGSRGRGRWGARKRARSEEQEEQPEDFGDEAQFGAPAEISPVPSYYRDQVLSRQ